MNTSKNIVVKTFIILGFLFSFSLNQFSIEYSVFKDIIVDNIPKDIIELDKIYNFSPYILRANYNKGKILYYGSFHNVDVSHPQFEDIERKWNRFKPDIAFSESMKWPLIKNKNEAIKKYGEQGLLRYLAYRDKVKIKCIDPPRRKETQYLLKHYPISKVKTYYTLRQIIIDKEIFNKKEINVNYINSFLKNISRRSYYSNSYPRNIRELKHIARENFPDLKNLSEMDSSYLMDITRKYNWMAKMNIKVNKYRDIYMSKKILKTMKKGKKIFAVVGKSHVIDQEKSLLRHINKIK